jgi:hypothetical protein
MMLRPLGTGAAVALAAVLTAGCALMPDPGPSVRIVEPSDGQTVTSPFKVRFAVSDGLKVEPVGEIKENSGHHHLLINLDSVPTGSVIPADDRHLHFGKGQTETMVTLEPGVYKLTAQFANGVHQSYGLALSHTITVTVRK